MKVSHNRADAQFAAPRIGMNTEEARWVAALKDFLRFIRAEAPHTADSFVSFVASLEGLLSEPTTTVETKYQEARRLESVFGGMGSVNDYPWSPEADRSRIRLFEAVQNVLRVYWRDLGRPSHDPGEFEPIPVGTAVRLVEGRVLFINRDESVVTVPETAARKKWEVEGAHTPDVTGMPMYLLRAGNTYQLARREAIECT